ncbi:hypothetical protein Pcinc_022276 [Petrolisthes cinctipes]|uniref:Uncharacterized protein n=1 Tax=Petrolisthes cinctipes TaxID=88211 RepID=A0AAE1KG81_PETCI|nr:hypothetical protein Pcinc_022276 [Petrolisthes cinctipes]
MGCRGGLVGLRIPALVAPPEMADNPLRTGASSSARRKQANPRRKQVLPLDDTVRCYCCCHCRRHLPAYCRDVLQYRPWARIDPSAPTTTTPSAPRPVR